MAQQEGLVRDDNSGGEETTMEVDEGNGAEAVQSVEQSIQGGNDEASSAAATPKPGSAEHKAKVQEVIAAIVEVLNVEALRLGLVARLAEAEKTNAYVKSLNEMVAPFNQAVAADAETERSKAILRSVDVMRRTREMVESIIDEASRERKQTSG
ncbi:hypothetical protein LTR53_000556 [Teratosphaeriaceae sp. CCFEE 6253]|nr:hypothetical protein LTR53_000556 [Teratosphaeriaceae sp. CCFEE 6253]